MKSRCLFRIEGLEERAVLAAPADVVVDPIPCPLDEVDVSIQQVVLKINGQETALQQLESAVVVAEGDTIELFEVDYQVTAAPSGCEAVIGAEAYFRKGNEFDYADGRFADTRDTDPFASRDMALTLNGAWQVGDNWDRMSIPLLGYSDDDIQVYDRFFVNFQVVDDLAFALSDTFRALRDETYVVGNDANLPGAWINNGQTPQTADMEVQIYTSATGLTPIWTGRFTATAGAGETIVGSFIDSRGNRWVPSNSGTHYLSFYVDPDRVLLEGREWNNFGLLAINVG